MKSKGAWPRAALGGFLVLVAASGRTETATTGVPSGALPRLKTLVVTATRYEKPVESVPANVTAITQEDIADSTARDIPGILRKEAGLHVYDITGNGRSHRVDRGGFGATAGLNTLVLVDGRRINNPDLAGVDWTLIPLNRVTGIETVRGSRGSVLYGDNATDGVINIITGLDTKRRAFPALEFGVEWGKGGYDAQDAGAYVRGNYQDLSYALSGRYYEADGYRQNSGTRQGAIGLDLGYVLGDRAQIGLSAGYQEDDTGLPGSLRLSELAAGRDRRSSTKPFDFADKQDYYIQLHPEIYFLTNSTFRVPLAYRGRESSFFATFDSGEFRGNTDIDSVTVSPQFVVREPIGPFDNDLTFGFDYYHAQEDIRNESLFSGQTSIGRFDLEKENYGLYIHDEFSATDRLTLSAGYRWDKVAYDFSPTTDGTPDHADYDENVFSTGVNYRFLENSYAYLSFAQGFRYPVLDEIFSFSRNRVNQVLKPQTSDNYELGVRHYFADNLYGHLNLFRLDTSDELFYDSANTTNRNLEGKIRREGIELSAGFDAQSLSLRGSYTYRDTEIKSGAYSGSEVPNVPRHQASVDLVWRPWEGLSLALNGTHVGKRHFESDFANSYARQEDYRVFNVKINYAWQKYRVFLDLNNVFDERYAAYGVISTSAGEPALYPSPEFNVFAGLRFDY